MQYKEGQKVKTKTDSKNTKHNDYYHWWNITTIAQDHMVLTDSQGEIMVTDKKETGYAQNKDTSSTKLNHKMKTKDFIKMLQEADPQGEGYIRMSGGIPIYAEAKAGYWDGPYTYLDENGNYVYSIENYKVDIHCEDLESYVWEKVSIQNPNNLSSWEKFKNHFIFKLGGYAVASQRKEREDSFLKIAKEHFDDAIAFEKQQLEKYTKESVEKYNLGWRFFQNKKVDLNERPNMHVYYTWFIEEPGKTNKKASSCVADVEGVLYSGLFERLDNNAKDEYYEWKLK